MRITSKGQVTIPMHVREQLGLLPHTEVEFEIDGDAVKITKASHQRRSLGWKIVEHSRGRATSGMTTDQLMKLLRG